MHSLPHGMKIALTIAETEAFRGRWRDPFLSGWPVVGWCIALTLDGSSADVAINWLTGEPRIVK